MSLRTTKHDVMANFMTINCGYGRLQNLLRFSYPVAHTSGKYGWNADVYIFDHVALVCGYRCFGNYVANNELLQEYDIKAKAIWIKNSNYQHAQEAITDLLNDFINHVQKLAIAQI